MAGLLDLSAELLLCIAAFVNQTDLLNLSLTSKKLRAMTEPELFREYNNLAHRARTFAPFVRRLIERPDLTKYVKRLNLRAWPNLSTVERIDRIRDDALDSGRESEPSADDYDLMTVAAKNAGIIESIYPYELESHVIKEIFLQRPLSSYIYWEQYDWVKHLFDPDIPARAIPPDQVFCQNLRAGIEDSFIVLLLALLPNVQEIHLYGVPESGSLPWKAPTHRFKLLHPISAQSLSTNMFPLLSWGILGSRSRNI
jgi:hypothetical protein